jgi:hypothetical protein
MMVKLKFLISKYSQIFEEAGVFLYSLYAKPSLIFTLRGRNSALIEFHEAGGAQTMNGIYVRLRSETVVRGLRFMKNICHCNKKLILNSDCIFPVICENFKNEWPLT